MEQLTVVPTNSSNISSMLAPPQPVFWNSSHLVPGVLMSLCFLLGVPGNLGVMVFLRHSCQQLSSTSRRLMLNLAVSDILCLITLPLWVHALLNSWSFGLVACKVLTYIMYSSIYGSLLTVTLLSIQRYLQVVCLQRPMDQWRERAILFLLWVVAMILGSPTLVVRQLVEDENWTYCSTDFSSNTQQVVLLLIETLLGFVFPFSIIAFSYIRLHNRVNQTSFFNNPRITRLVTSVIVTFFALWIPYHIVNVLSVAAILLGNQVLLESCSGIRNTVGALTFVNSCLDPLFYAFASQNMCSACSNV